jgi:eukaryotic-like serine/threonine-protein kinase
MQTIHLAKGEWQFDEAAPLGPKGGFGEVFKGEGANGPVAVKRLLITAGAAAYRELNIGEDLAARELKHVVPILDWGQDAHSDRYFLVMPTCKRSLKDELRGDPIFSVDKLCAVTLDIIAGLTEVEDIVHRDLKPGNVLLLNGRWRLADFGIAKFVEDSTSLDTMRRSLTREYGAPEQWRGERPSHATDVYALGCMIYQMATGEHVFPGPDFRASHLHSPAPAIQNANTRLSAFVTQMLRKSPAARPSLERCKSVFEALSVGVSNDVHPALAHAAVSIAQSSAATDAGNRLAESRAMERQALFEEAARELGQIRTRLFNLISSSSDEIMEGLNELKLGNGTLCLGDVGRERGRRDGKPNCPRSGWDVCCSAEIFVDRGVREAKNGRLFGNQQFQVKVMEPAYRWSATLSFATTQDDTTFRWREVNFYRTLVIDKGVNEPLALPSNSDEFDSALSNLPDSFGVAYGPKTIDGEDELIFHRRWSFLFARAATGELEKPNAFPIQDHFFE